MVVDPVTPPRFFPAGPISEGREMLESFPREQFDFLREVSNVTGSRFLFPLYHVARLIKRPVATNLAGLTK